MDSAAELHRKSDPGAEYMLRIILKEFCMDARYSDSLIKVLTALLYLSFLYKSQMWKTNNEHEQSVTL